MAKRTRRLLTVDDLARNPRLAASVAGLRYVRDEGPCIRRIAVDGGFVYRGPEGRRIRDRATLERIRSLAVPPAWTDVWICPIPNGHIQATGRDARGRKQYRYHPGWRALRDSVKYDRMLAFADALPRIRRRVEQDLTLPGLPRAKVLAAVVRLLDATAIRIGNEEYARQNHSFGLTTLRDRHARIEGSHVRFTFRGKSGKQHTVEFSDRRLARIVKQCRDVPGQELFQYVDHLGAHHAIESADVNDYVREISGGDFTAKDFRTWTGTVLALRSFAALEPAGSDHARRHQVAEVVREVAGHLGNTPAVCRKAYIHPGVIESFSPDRRLPLDLPPPDLAARANEGTGLHPDERALVELLQSLSAGPAEKAAA